MGNMQFSGCHDARSQMQILEIDCPKCHEQEGIEVFTKDHRSVGDSECISCGYILPENTVVEKGRTM